MYNDHPWDFQKGLLYRCGHYHELVQTKLALKLVELNLGSLLLTGGHYS
jgi:hypothetical protein